MRTSKYRVLTYSNNLFVPEYKFLCFWFSFGEQFQTIGEAKNFIENEKIIAQKPTVVDVNYIV